MKIKRFIKTITKRCYSSNQNRMKKKQIKDDWWSWAMCAALLGAVVIAAEFTGLTDFVINLFG